MQRTIDTFLTPLVKLRLRSRIRELALVAARCIDYANSMSRSALPPNAKPKVYKQVAALPVASDASGALRVMLITSRETRRLIIPKGWAMKGRKDHRAAAIEAKEEAGLIGRIHRKPIGTYTYWKRRPSSFVYCKVKVYVLEVSRQLADWRERTLRQGIWLLVDDAAERVSEPGLVTIIRDLPDALPTRRNRSKAMTAPG